MHSVLEIMYDVLPSNSCSFYFNLIKKRNYVQCYYGVKFTESEVLETFVSFSKLNQ